MRGGQHFLYGEVLEARLLPWTVVASLLLIVVGCSDPFARGFPDVGGAWQVTENHIVEGGFAAPAPLSAGEMFFAAQEGSTVVLTLDDDEHWTTVTIRSDGSFAEEHRREGAVDLPGGGTAVVEEVAREEGAFFGDRMEHRYSLKQDISIFDQQGRLVETQHENGASITRARRVSR